MIEPKLVVQVAELSKQVKALAAQVAELKTGLEKAHTRIGDNAHLLSDALSLENEASGHRLGEGGSHYASTA